MNYLIWLDFFYSSWKDSKWIAKKLVQAKTAKKPKVPSSLAKGPLFLDIKLFLQKVPFEESAFCKKCLKMPAPFWVCAKKTSAETVKRPIGKSAQSCAALNHVATQKSHVWGSNSLL